MKKAYGFTIVELLIVIVVIGILAAISIVAYNNISNQANDSAVKSDLKTAGQKITMYHSETGNWPITIAQLKDLNFGITKSAYGHHHQDLHNFLYCRGSNAVNDFAIVARSKSSKKFVYSKGSVSEFTGRWDSSDVTCEDAGIPLVDFSHRIYVYSLSAWAF